MQKPFDSQKYLKLQTKAIKDRMEKFPRGRFYFEIGGKFLHDDHASRVLPGFDPKVKVEIVKSVSDNLEVIFCINSEETNQERILKDGKGYKETNLEKLEELVEEGFPKPKVVLNLYSSEDQTEKLEEKLRNDGYQVFKRYRIKNYPKDQDNIVSKDGFGKDDYIESASDFVLVVAAEPNSGKMSTALGQVYLDKQKGINSGYAKYETFPVWNLPLEHPVNLAYEAATADIEDYNLYDPFHEKAYGKKAVNYNRDVDAFPIVKGLIDKIIDKDNFMSTYKSPTDMGISNVGFCINNNEEIRKSATEEIRRRKGIYQKLVDNGKGEKSWVERCEELLESLE
ncbi:MAG TPA: DUF1846 family protein [bacterium]|nr:DUF1846 family protein [bacterium]